MTQHRQHILTLNAGSSSIKFALFAAAAEPRLACRGSIERIGSSGSLFAVQGGVPEENFSRQVAATDHAAAMTLLMNWLRDREIIERLVAVGHRVVHGGANYHEPQLLTSQLLAELRRLSPLDPTHLPEEILLMEACSSRAPALSQIVCFDTAFHHDMPRVAQLLPIPNRYQALGVRRYGFHGLSYEFLMSELTRIDRASVVGGRCILAHLGNGASLSAVRNGKSIDTSMGFTPASGLMMGTRSGDIDPGLPSYLAQTEGLNATQFDALVNTQSGLLGVSGTSADMRDLLQRETDDPHAADAISLYCYQIKKWIGAFTAVLGGLDTLVFTGGVGENAAAVRARVCEGLDAWGIALDPVQNDKNAALISTDTSRVRVRVIHTDEELVIARAVYRLSGLAVA